MTHDLPPPHASVNKPSVSHTDILQRLPSASVASGTRETSGKTDSAGPHDEKRFYKKQTHSSVQVNVRRILPGRVPRPELSKNCLGQDLDRSLELPPASKNLLLGESSRETLVESTSFLGDSRTLLGDSRTFLGDSRTFLGVTTNFLGELRKSESEVMGKPLLVGVQGDDGLLSSALVFTFSLMALLFHLLISAC